MEATHLHSSIQSCCGAAVWAGDSAGRSSSFPATAFARCTDHALKSCRRQEGRRKHGCPEARRHSPCWRRRHGSDRRHGGRGHSRDRGHFSLEGFEASLSMAALVSASVSAAAVTHQTGAAAAGGCAKRKRDCLSVAEGEVEVGCQLCSPDHKWCFRLCMTSCHA